MKMAPKIIIPEEVRQKYIERRKKDLTDCRLALSNADFKCFAFVGHQIKGNAVTFGFDELTPIAIEMETLAVEKNVNKLHELLNRFEACLSRF